MTSPEMQNTIQAREKLDAQRQENLGVKKEFDRIKPGEDIYKLVGPVLLKQDKVEAESTVDGRLEFLRKELCVEPDPRSASCLADYSC